ncbi:unnamed protein product [Caretta caretta]
MEDDLLDIDDTHGIWNSELLQQFELDSHSQVDTDDPFGLDLDTRQPTTDHLYTLRDNFQPMSTSIPHVAKPLNDILDTLNTEATAALQQALMIVKKSVQAPDLPQYCMMSSPTQTWLCLMMVLKPKTVLYRCD